MKHIVLACTVLTLPLNAGADTLSVAIDKAIKFSPSHQSEIRNYEKQLQNKRISDGALIPKVEINANTKNLRTGGNTVNSKRLVVSQTLYKGGAIWAGRTQSNYKIKQSYATLRSKEQSLILNVVSAYTGVLTARQTQAMRQKLLDVAEDNLNTVRERVQAELANKEELLDVQSKLATAVANKFAADGKLQLAENEYFTVVGEKAPQNMQDLETLAKSDRLNVGSLDKALKQGLKNNPDVQSARFGVEVAKQAMLIKRGSLLPSVSVEYSHRIYENSGRLGGRSSDDSVTLSTKIPLYQQGVAWAGLEQARLDQRRALNSLDTAKLTNETNIRRYLFDVESSQKTVKSYAVALKTSNERLKVVREEFQSGNKTLSNFNEAESNVTSARVSYLSAMKDAILARYRLQAALGDLSPENQFNPNIENNK